MRPVKWDREDLKRRLCHALDIAHRAVERLGPAGYTDPQDAAISVRPEKVISETALLVLAASHTSCDAVRERVHRVARELIPYVRSDRMRLGLCLEPALALDYASGHVCLKRLGYADAGFDVLVNKALQSHASNGKERVPHRAMEQWWIGRHCGADSSWARRRSAVAQSALNLPMDLLSGSRDDVYAFTHALMYATDLQLTPGRLPRPRKTIVAEAEAALGWCLDAEDYDLGGEVLLTWPLTGRSWSAPSAFAFRVLARVEDTAGFLPAPITRIARANAMEGEQRTDYLLATAYHTIYVMGLLCAAALQPGKEPPAFIPTNGAKPGSSGRFLRLLSKDSRRPHWWEDFHALKECERDALSGLLLVIGLRRSVQRREFGELAELLQQACDCGLLSSPAVKQAAEMLERLASFSNLRAGSEPAAA